MSSAPSTAMSAAMPVAPPLVPSASINETEEPIELVCPAKRFTVEEYWRMLDAGILTDEDRVELLEGVIVVKMTKHPPHDGMIDLLMNLLWRALPLGWYPRCQHAFITSDSVPEPDIAVVHGPPQEFMKRHPKASDVALMIEVADSSQRRDRRKRTIYARAGVIQYWIVDVNCSRLEIYSEPDPAAGEYKQQTISELAAAHTFSLPDAGPVTLDIGAALAAQPE